MRGMTLFTPNTKVGTVNHVGIAVLSLEESMKQFQELFDSPESEIILSEENGVRGTFINQGDTHIELLQPIRDDSPIAKFIKTHGEGIHHMAFTVPEVDAKAEELVTRGVPIIVGPRPGLSGRIAFVDPKVTHGVLIELVRPYGT
jgi:methylmalonyl-CoA epimerase